jgi:hypothetical protein
MNPKGGSGGRFASPRARQGGKSEQDKGAVVANGHREPASMNERSSWNPANPGKVPQKTHSRWPPDAQQRFGQGSGKGEMVR